MFNEINGKTYLDYVQRDHILKIYLLLQQIKTKDNEVFETVKNTCICKALLQHTPSHFC
jgi:hypothetical protein